LASAYLTLMQTSPLNRIAHTLEKIKTWALGLVNGMKTRRLDPLKFFTSPENRKTEVPPPMDSLVKTTPGGGLEMQSSNRLETWSINQRTRKNVFSGLRFEGINLNAQPRPLAAIELLDRVPVEIVKSRSVSCDGGGALGHPRIFINLVSILLFQEI